MLLLGHMLVFGHILYNTQQMHAIHITTRSGKMQTTHEITFGGVKVYSLNKVDGINILDTWD